MSSSRNVEQTIRETCEAAKENSESTRRRLIEAAAEFQRRVDLRIPSKSSAAFRIVKLVSGADWPRVYPQGMFELAPWFGTEDRVAFLPSQWHEVDANEFRRALEHRHRAFVALDRIYRKARQELSEERLAELFRDGAPRP
jgi:hypothetical protein